MMDTNKYLGYWAECYREDLVQNIMPFWMKYGLDRENGGVYTCVARDGELMDTTKSVWFQGRFAYICCILRYSFTLCASAGGEKIKSDASNATSFGLSPSTRSITSEMSEKALLPPCCLNVDGVSFNIKLRASQDCLYILSFT